MMNVKSTALPAATAILLVLVGTASCEAQIGPPPGGARPTTRGAPAAAPSMTADPPVTRQIPTSVPPSATLLPTVESLRATVIVDLLSCRYGPGPAYLFLYALRNGANIRLIGRTDGENWHWVYVEGANRCWVNATFIRTQGNIRALPVVYPGLAKLPVSPSYPSTSVLSATREGNAVTVEWLDIPLRPGDQEDERMQHYIIEVWLCQDRRVLFEPLATNETTITLVDEPGCDRPSHGRIFVQEKHGLAGPAEILWPPP